MNATVLRYQSMDGIALQRRQDNRRELAYALRNSAEILHIRHQYDDALVRLDEARRLFDEIGDRYGQSMTLLLVGKVLLDSGLDDESEGPLVDGIKLCREMGDEQNALAGVADLARLWFRRGDRDRARSAFVGSVRLGLAGRDPRYMGNLIRTYIEFLDDDGDATEIANLNSTLADPRTKAAPDHLALILERIEQNTPVSCR